jgi:chromosome segregation ATPase
MNFQQTALDIQQLKSTHTALNNLYIKRQTQHDTLQAQYASSLARLKEVTTQIDLYEKTRILLQEAGKIAREEAKKQIEQLVTDALQFVFESDNIAFEIEMKETRGRVEANFWIVSEYEGKMARFDATDSRGGGVVDIVSLALRLAMLQAFKPEVGGPLMLDEPGKHVSAEFSGNMARFLKEVAGRFGRQTIMVTHNAELAGAADVAYGFLLEDGKSRVTRLVGG